MRAARRLRVASLAVGALVVVSACSSSPPPPVDFDPTLPASAATDSTDAPAIAGVPPCPASETDAPQRAGSPVLPAASLACLTKGPSVNLAGLRGRPTVITIWASWCAPCRDEIPLFVNLQDRADGSLRVLGVDVRDRAAPARAAVEDFGMNFPSVSDPEALTKKTVNYPGPPVTLFVDAEGVITYRRIGQITSQQQLDSLVAQHLGVTVR